MNSAQLRHGELLAENRALKERVDALEERVASLEKVLEDANAELLRILSNNLGHA